MATNPKKQALRDERRKQGQCLHCGNPALPAPIGHKHPTLTYCERHKKAHAASRDKAIDRNKQSGLCHNAGCSNRPQPGNNHCDSCNEKSATRTSLRRQEAVASGKCAYCDKPHLPGITRCRHHRDQLAAAVHTLQERRIARGKCGRCGDEPLVPGYRSGRKCIDKGIARHATFKLDCLDAYGGPVCVGCGETEVAVLQIDHIDGGGHKHALKLGNGNCAKGRAMMYRYLRDAGFPPGYRVLCANCNIRAARRVAFPIRRPLLA